jgi:histone H3/H4
MSTRKRPLGELSNPPSAKQTPRRWAPSTPHAIRALQERSGAKTRSLRTRKIAPEVVDPASARGVLRRLAKLTAPTTRTLRTPNTVGKENEILGGEGGAEDDDDDDVDERLAKRPRMTFDIDESIDESIEEEPPQYEEEDSELPTAPTPSVLPDEDPTITFQSINMASGNRRKSRLSMPPVDRDEELGDEDQTMMTERGRRAVTEEATGRLSRYSFGSIRMSDFGTELEYARDSNGKFAEGYPAELQDARKSLGPVLGVDETENLAELTRPVVDDSTMFDVGVPLAGEDNFELQLPVDEATAAERRLIADVQPVEEDGWEDVQGNEDHEPVHLSPKSKRRLTGLQMASARQDSGKRRRRVKMTKHGTLVPSLPTNLIKKIAVEVQVRNGRRKPGLAADHVKALEQATEWFFEQVGEDLAAYSSHGRRKRRIAEDDALMLLKRQGAVKDGDDLRQLAKTWLPRDIRSDLEIPDDL